MAFVTPLDPTSMHPVAAVPLQVETSTTESPQVFVLSMTVDDHIPDMPWDSEVKAGTETPTPFPSNPLDTTLTWEPEPQRSSMPNVNDDNLNMNETIVAGFWEVPTEKIKHFVIGGGPLEEGAKKEVSHKVLPEWHGKEEENKKSDAKTKKGREKGLCKLVLSEPTKEITEQPQQQQNDAEEKEVLCEKNEDEVYNKTYCWNWILNSGENSNVHTSYVDAQSDSLHNKNNLSESLLDVTSVSRNVQKHLSKSKN